MTDISPAQDDTQTNSPVEAEPTAHRQAEFLGQVDKFIKGDARPTHQASGPIVEDLRATAAGQEEARKQLQQIQESATRIQSALLQAQGRADGLLMVLHRLEAE